MADIKGRTIAATYGKLLYTSTDDGLIGNTGSTTSVITTDDTDGTSTASCLNLGIDRVGIGTAAPGGGSSAPLHIYKAATTGSVPIALLNLEISNESSTNTDIGEGPAINFYVSDDTPSTTGAYVGADESHLAGQIATVHTSTDLMNGAGAMTFSTALNNAALIEAMRIDEAGNVMMNYNVGIGTSSPDDNLEIAETAGNAIVLITTYSDTESTTSHLRLRKSDNTEASPAAVDTDAILGRIEFQGYNSSSFVSGARIQGMAEEGWDGNSAGTHLSFWTVDSGVDSQTLDERMRIDHNGNVGIGTTAPASLLHVIGAVHDTNQPLVAFDGNGIEIDNTDVILQLSFSQDSTATAGHFIEFRDGDDAEMTGTIVANDGTATNNTVSDYRKKENISLITGGLTKINALKPSYFNYIAYPNTVHQGFIAHEVEEAGIGYAVFGDKDAVKDDGSIESQEFAVTNIMGQMVSAIQELSAKVEALENA